MGSTNGAKAREREREKHTLWPIIDAIVYAPGTRVLTDFYLAKIKDVVDRAGCEWEGV